MKRHLSFLLLTALAATAANAQKQPKTAGYAITAAEKGRSGWKEVRLVDAASGETLKNVYQNKQEAELLNARTKKPVVKKDAAISDAAVKRVVLKNLEGVTGRTIIVTGTEDTVEALNKLGNLKNITLSKVVNVEKATGNTTQTITVAGTGNTSKEIKLDAPNVQVSTTPNPTAHVRVKANAHVTTNVNTDVHVYTNTNTNTNVEYRKDGVKHTYIFKSFNTMPAQTDQPFAGTSAACAYDKKHDRLYYTPMNFAQLRYIDLKSDESKIYYFEDEAFGVVKGSGDVENQITRMAFGADGNGYALSNDANHLIRFTTGKRPEITDLGALTDEAGNKISVHSRNGFGGDMVADKDDNLYLVTANRRVFKINIETKNATYLGNIKGLPDGFSTNGAMVEGGSKVIVCSSESTVGYYKFDLLTLEAEKVSNGGQVFNASDLANGNLAFEKEKKKRNDAETVKPVDPVPAVTEETARKAVVTDLLQPTQNSILAYPNPVTDGMVKLAFNGQPAGVYQITLLDINGKLLSTREVTISSKNQVIEFRTPELLAKGTYLVKVYSEALKVNNITKISVQ